jgi:hypothetical protein
VITGPGVCDEDTSLGFRALESGIRPLSRDSPNFTGCRRARYLTSVSILNIGRYIEMITMPTITPTPSIMIGSTIDVRAPTDASTSSS